MAARTTVSRQPLNLARLSSPRSASLVHRRGLASGGDHHGPPKVNFWQDPMNPSKWKEEHFVIVSLTGWGLLFYGGYKFFTRGNDKKEEGRKLKNRRTKPEVVITSVNSLFVMRQLSGL